MAVTYTWEVTGLKTTTVANTSDVVVQTYWKKKGTDEAGNTGEFSGATPFSANSMPANTSFVPFADLTEADVLSIRLSRFVVLLLLEMILKTNILGTQALLRKKLKRYYQKLFQRIWKASNMLP